MEHVRTATSAVRQSKDRYRLIADLRGSAMVANGSRAPSFGAIHFFSLAIISSSNFLSWGPGMYSFTCNSYALSSSGSPVRSEEHTSELQSHSDLVCRLLLEKKKNYNI